MKRPQSLQEFAEDMRRKGDIRDTDLADEIFALIDLEEEVAEPYSNLLMDLENYAPKGLRDKPEKAMEWLGDRSNLLAEIEELLANEGYSDCGPDEAIRNLLDKLDGMESTLNDLQAVVDAQPNGKFTYDL